MAKRMKGRDGNPCVSALGHDRTSTLSIPVRRRGGNRNNGPGRTTLTEYDLGSFTEDLRIANNTKLKRTAVHSVTPKLETVNLSEAAKKIPRRQCQTKKPPEAIPLTKFEGLSCIKYLAEDQCSVQNRRGFACNLTDLKMICDDGYFMIHRMIARMGCKFLKTLLAEHENTPNTEIIFVGFKLKAVLHVTSAFYLGYIPISEDVLAEELNEVIALFGLDDLVKCPQLPAEVSEKPLHGIRFDEQSRQFSCEEGPDIVQITPTTENLSNLPDLREDLSDLIELFDKADTLPIIEPADIPGITSSQMPPLSNLGQNMVENSQNTNHLNSFHPIQLSHPIPQTNVVHQDQIVDQVENSQQDFSNQLLRQAITGITPANSVSTIPPPINPSTSVNEAESTEVRCELPPVIDNHTEMPGPSYTTDTSRRLGQLEGLSSPLALQISEQAPHEKSHDGVMSKVVEGVRFYSNTVVTPAPGRDITNTTPSNHAESLGSTGGGESVGITPDQRKASLEAYFRIRHENNVARLAAAPQMMDITTEYPPMTLRFNATGSARPSTPLYTQQRTGTEPPLTQFPGCIQPLLNGESKNVYHVHFMDTTTDNQAEMNEVIPSNENGLDPPNDPVPSSIGSITTNIIPSLFFCLECGTDCGSSENFTIHTCADESSVPF